jgi:hypothetical protein
MLICSSFSLPATFLFCFLSLCLCFLLLFGGFKGIISEDSKVKIYKDIHTIFSSSGGSVEPPHHNVAPPLVPAVVLQPSLARYLSLFRILSWPEPYFMLLKYIILYLTGKKTDDRNFSILFCGTQS